MEKKTEDVKSEVKAKPAAKRAEPVDLKTATTKVKNNTSFAINTSKGRVEPGETVTLPEMEARRMRRFLDRV